MGETTPRPGRNETSSAVLTPPFGLPALDLTGLIPQQRPPADSTLTSPVAPNEPPTPADQAPVVDPCTCGHARADHEHYRPGSDCGVCGAQSCASFRRRGGRVRQALRRLRLVR